MSGQGSSVCPASPICRAWLVCQASLVFMQAAAAASGSPFAFTPEVEQPRSFGHFVGDLLRQRIPLDDGNQYFRPSSLPTADRVGLWFQRLPPHLETEAGKHWLVIDYQIINSPLLPVSVALPALTIATQRDAPIKVDSWPIHISPLSAKPAYANVEPLPLHPDRLPAALPTASLRRQLVGLTAALVLVLAAWPAWSRWRNRRDARRLPFARAFEQLRGFRPDADTTDAWLCVHRALNETAGRAVQENSVPRLLESAPQLAPLRPDLEEFYRRSNARFFAKSAPDAPFALVELCGKLCRIERQTSRGQRLGS